MVDNILRMGAGFIFTLEIFAVYEQQKRNDVEALREKL